MNEKLTQALLKVLKPAQVSIKPRDQLAYSRDCSMSATIRIRGLDFYEHDSVIVWPKNNTEIISILQCAKQFKVPVIPYGAGSGVCGSAVPLKPSILMDLKFFDQILEIDEENLRVKAQCGILGEILERKLNQKGYTLGHFPSSIYCSTLGGYLACRSAGQLSNKYGKIEDMVLAMEVILANGKTLQLGLHNGVDAKELFVGSEGMFAVFTEATLKIHPLAEAQRYRGIEFPSVELATQAMKHLFQQGIKPAVVRLYDPLDSLIFFFKRKSKKSHPNEAKHNPLLNTFMQEWMGSAQSSSLKFALSHAKQLNQMIDFGLHRCLLILGFEGTAWRAQAELEASLEFIQKFGGRDLGEEPGLRWLNNRYSISYKLSPVFDKGCFADTFEIAATWTNLLKVYENVRRAVSPHALIMAHFSHAYHDGACIYFTFASTAATKEASLNLHKTIWQKAMEACHEAGGTISHHHGVGTLKASVFQKEMGSLMHYLRETKKFLDSNSLFNPGKMGVSQ